MFSFCKWSASYFFFNFLRFDGILGICNSIPNNKISVLSKLKAITDNKVNLT